MQQFSIVESTSTRLNHHVDPQMHIWGWEVPVYLFLGGLVAGLMLLNSAATLLNKETRYKTSANFLPLLTIPLLGLGLGALFLDLEYKMHVYRFYTAFRISSPMSWGSWVLLIVGVTGGLTFVRSLLHYGVVRGGLFSRLGAYAERKKRSLAWSNLILGLVLGIYTGVLLSSFVARPLWNSALLGPLFLVSGASTAAALAAILSGPGEERETLVKLDLVLIFVELMFLGLWMAGLANGGASGREALDLLLSGSFSASFWALVVVLGLAVPAVLEVQALRHRWADTLVAPALVIVGGIALRFVLVQAGQFVGIGG